MQAPKRKATGSASFYLLLSSAFRLPTTAYCLPRSAFYLLPSTFCLLFSAFCFPSALMNVDQKNYSVTNCSKKC